MKQLISNGVKLLLVGWLTVTLWGCTDVFTARSSFASQIVPYAADFDDGNGLIPDDFPSEFGVEPSLNVYPNLVNYIELVSDTVRDGKYALKITVDPQFQTQQPDRPIKNRTEVNYKHNNVEGTQVWYQWSFLIPTDFIELDPSLYPDSWNIIGQFHAIADPENGMPSAAGTNPPVALYLGRQTKDGPFGVKLNYGIQNENVGPAGYFPVAKGQWIDFKMHIKWSQDDTGYIEAWANGVSVTNGKYYGKNMHNTKPHYWKSGFYRGAGMPYNNSIYIDEFRVGNTQAQVSIR